MLGVVNLDKPVGPTSHDMVDLVRRLTGMRRIGHAGTLDPMATGLLVLGVGRATRLLRFLGVLPKTYEGTARLGVETTTLDADGDVTLERPVTATEAEVREAMASLVGESMQLPPAYSAVKIGGRKLYDAARRGEVLEAAPRRIHVDAFDLLAIRGPDVDFRVTCSGGTYVRVLLADVGAGGRAPSPSRAESGGSDRREPRPDPRAGGVDGPVRGLRAPRPPDRYLRG